MGVIPDASCTTLVLELFESGTYVLEGQLTLSLAGQAQQILYSPNTITITIVDAGLLAGFFNPITYCGFNNWVLNVGKSILGLTCTVVPHATDGIRARVTEPGIGGNIYEVIGISADNNRLYLSDNSTHKGLSTGDRPTALDSSFYLGK